MWRVTRWCVLVAAVGWLWGCSGDTGPKAGMAGTPTPTASPSPRICTPDLGPDASERAREALFAVQLSIIDGATLVDAMESVFGVPTAAMTTVDRADALRVLAGLDLCPRESARVRDDIPPLIHRLAEQGGSRLVEGTRPSPLPRS